MSEPTTTNLNQPFPDAGDLHLSIAAGACRLAVRAGAAEPWLSGTYHDPTGEVPLRVAQEDGTLRLSQQYGFPGVLKMVQGTPRFELLLGTARPYALTLEGGASENDLSLGGLPLRRLIIRHGAGKLDLDFSSPNTEVMTLLEMSTGAGALDARGLANAGFSELRLEGGAASYRLDFGGRLQRDANVRVNTGVSAVELVIPASTAAKVSVESPMASLDVGDGWTTRSGAFWNEAAIGGGTPVLTVSAAVALGSLRLRAG